MIAPEFWDALADTLDAGIPAFLSVVIDSTPGSPGTPGAALFVRPDQTRHGTIGGGIMEFNLLTRATDVLREQNDFTERETLWHRKDAPGTPSGMICSGSQSLVHHLCLPEPDADTIRQTADHARAQGAAALLFTPDGIAFEPDAGGGPPFEWFEDGDGRLARIRLMNRRRAAILGGGHCGRALSHTLRGLDYHVTVFDPRADEERFATNEDAHRKVVLKDFADAGEQVELPEHTQVIVMTKDYPSDVRALAGLLPHPFPFIGVMGSGAKIERIHGDLQEQGFDDAALARIRAPVGLPIGSHTPAEIAVSIAAQLIQENHVARLRKTSTSPA